MGKQLRSEPPSPPVTPVKAGVHPSAAVPIAGMDPAFAGVTTKKTPARQISVASRSLGG
jgi:hypothetical protein